MEGGVVTAVLLRGRAPGCERGSGSVDPRRGQTREVSTTKWAFFQSVT